MGKPLDDFKDKWKSKPAFRSNLISLAVAVFSIGTLVYYLNTDKTERVGYKNPKIEMNYAAKNTDIPKLNTKGLMAVLGTKTDKMNCHMHTPLGSPKFDNNPPTNAALICHSGYATVFDLDAKTPLVVSHVLTRSNFINAPKLERQDKFAQDPFAEGDAFPKPSDYTRTGYDRGHLAPYADFSYNQQKADESFYMTNIAPQNPKHNQNIWGKLENDIRKLLMRGKVCVPVPEQDRERFEALPAKDKCQGDNLYPMQRVVDIEQLYITTGVVYHVEKRKGMQQLGNPDGTLGIFKSGIKIPNYFYKIIFEPRTGMSAAYLIPNVEQVGNDSYHKYHIPIVDLEKNYTGVSYFDSIPTKDKKKFKNYFLTQNNGTVSVTDGRNGMLDRFLF